jgi:transposase
LKKERKKAILFPRKSKRKGKETSMNKNSIELTEEQRKQLEEAISKGKATARKIKHAQVLLKIDSGKDGPNWSDGQVREAFGVSPATIWRIRRRFLETGLDDALNRRPQPDRPQKRKLDGEQEAHLIALTCSQAPEGHQRWTMRLLADKIVQLGYVEQVSHKTVWMALKKMNSSLG